MLISRSVIFSVLTCKKYCLNFRDTYIYYFGQNSESCPNIRQIQNLTRHSLFGIRRFQVPHSQRYLCTTSHIEQYGSVLFCSLFLTMPVNQPLAKCIPTVIYYFSFFFLFVSVFFATGAFVAFALFSFTRKYSLLVRVNFHSIRVNLSRLISFH